MRVEVLDRVHSQPDHVFGRAQPHLTRKRAGRRPHHTADRAAGDSLPLGGHGFTIGQVVEVQGFPGRSASANRAHSPQPTGQQPERAVQVLIDGIGLKGQIRASSLAQPGLVCRRFGNPLVVPDRGIRRGSEHRLGAEHRQEGGHDQQRGEPHAAYPARSWIASQVSTGDPTMSVAAFTLKG